MGPPVEIRGATATRTDRAQLQGALPQQLGARSRATSGQGGVCGSGLKGPTIRQIRHHPLWAQPVSVLLKYAQSTVRIQSS